MKEGTKKDEGKKDDNKKDENINPDKNDLEECQKKAEEYLNGWKRERADFLNYKKEEMERIGQLVKYANEEIILKSAWPSLIVCGRSIIVTGIFLFLAVWSHDK